MPNDETDQELRERALIIFQSSENKDIENVSPEVRKLVQELQIHQIELEIQNEDLISTQKTLEKSQRKYWNLYNFAPVGYFTLTEDGIIKDLNLTGAVFLGSVKNKLIKSAITRFMDQKSRREFYKHFKKAKKSGIKENCEIELIKPDNSTINVVLETIYDKNDQNGSDDFKTIMIDISEKKEIYNLLQSSEKRYQDLFNYSPIAIWEEDFSKLKSYLECLKDSGIDLETYLDENPDEIKKCINLIDLIDVNQFTLNLYHAQDKDEVFKGLKQIFLEESLSFFKKEILAVSEGKTRFFGESVNKTFEGEKIQVMINYVVPPGYEKTFSQVLVSILDITNLKDIENSLKVSLDDKEILLKEVHHRVKNNLQVISSLLNLQSDYIMDKADLRLFQDTQSRVKSMALIHELLYQSEDLKRINLSEYIETICNQLMNTYKVESGQIKLKIGSEGVMADINVAIPLGLIINELVSNCLKHAFPSNIGEIVVNIEKFCRKYTLKISDNGIGIPEEIDLKNIDSLGMKLVYGLVDQIGGTMDVKNEQGTTFIIEFEEE